MNPFGWVRPVVVAAAAAALAVAATALPAGAVEPTAVGWWWAGRPSAMFPSVFSPVPAPPEGGLYVAGGAAGGAAGPSGISAVRYELGSDASAGTLILTIARAEGTVAIDACPAKDPWEPAQNGGWDQRPEPNCEEASVSGVVDENQTEVTFPVFSLQRDTDVIDVVLVPGNDPATGSPASFSVAFEPPGADALATTEAPDTDTSAPTSAPPPARPVDAPSATAPASPGFVAPAAPTREPFGTPDDDETALRAGAPDQATGLTSSSRDLDGFAYPAVLALPLVLLSAASYLGWALTRPVTVTRGGRVVS